MARRQRRPADPNDFADPLSDYRPREYEDAFESFLSQSQVGAMPIQPFLQVEPGTSVRDVLALMTQREMYCVLIVENEKLLGVFSERDALNRVGERYEQVQDQPIRELMTPAPVTIYDTDSPAKALNLMAVGGFRHIPVLNLSDRPVGVLGPRRVVSLLAEHSG